MYRTVLKNNLKHYWYLYCSLKLPLHYIMETNSVLPTPLHLLIILLKDALIYQLSVSIG